MSPATLRDLALAVLIGVVAAVSPISSHELLPSLVAGVLAGAATFVVRRRMRAGEEPTPAVPSTGRSVPATLWPAIALYLALVGPTLVWMYHHWTTGVWVNNHSLFIPLVVGYLGYKALEEDASPGSAESSPWGLAIVAMGLLVLALDAQLGNGYLSVLGFLITLPGLSLLLLGPRRTRLLAVPLVVAPLMAPIPNSVASHLYLRRMTAWGTEQLLDLMRVPVIREATLLEAPHNRFVVSDACSGFATTYAAVAVAVILACYVKSPWRRGALVVAALPLAFLANVVRVLFLVLMSEGVGAWILETPIHEGSGVATFVAVLFGLFFIAGRPGREPRPA